MFLLLFFDFLEGWLISLCPSDPESVHGVRVLRQPAQRAVLPRLPQTRHAQNEPALRDLQRETSISLAFLCSLAEL